ncbi:hypothetical protein ACIPWE_35045 [Streptomyces sp. NPDC090073]|uniref:hypothetical protein n=1 Tax=Streptomyces sp. NPDC090073 TaxID=3365936 RepID=UPI00382D3529
MPGMVFVLAGRDDLSRVLDGAGDNADRLARRLADASRSGSTSVTTFTRDADGRLRDLRGRFISVADAQRQMGDGLPDLTRTMTTTTTAADDQSSAMEELVKVTKLLWPAAIPAAASLAPLAAGAMTVGVAMAAMAAAIGPQVAALSEASAAQKAYDDAVSKSGASSAEAAQAQAAMAQKFAQLPPATRKAAAAVGVLKDNFKQWSDSLAGDTMKPFTKGVQLVTALLPKTNGLVKAASHEADRFLTILGGEMASPGLDALNAKFTGFAEKTLRNLNNDLVHFLRVSDGGSVGAPLREFMDYARAQGPTVSSILRSVATVLVNVIHAGSGVGVSLLQTVEVIARLASAVPPGAISAYLQLALAMKVTKAAALGMSAGRTAIASFITQVGTVRTAAVGATGGLARLTAGFGALSRGMKLGIIGAAIAGIVLAISQLNKVGKDAKVSVDDLARSLQDGLTKGRIDSSVIDDLRRAQKGLLEETDSTASGWDKFMYSLKSGGSGWSESASSSQAVTNHLRDLGSAVNEIAKNKGLDTARQALDLLAKQGIHIPTKYLKDYNNLVKDSALEAKLAAQSMGIFGAAAQDTKTKLDAQKLSADGLRASIIALNEVNRSAHDAETNFFRSLDDLSAAFKKNGKTLDEHTEKGRANRDAMSSAAKSQDELIATGIAAGDSFESMSGKSSKLRAEMMRLATDAFDGNKRKAQAYVNTLLGTPSQVKSAIKLEKEGAVSGLHDVQAAIKATPGAKRVVVDTLNNAAIKALEAVGLKTKQLPNGKTAVFTANGQALGSIGSVARALANLNGRTANTYTNHHVTTFYTYKGRRIADVSAGRMATGGAVGPGGGAVAGPGTGTSDSIPMWLSNGEFVVNAKSTSKYRALLEAINSNRVGSGSGMSGAGSAVAAGLAQGMTGSTGTVDAAARTMAAAVVTGVKAELQIASPSKKTKALAKDVGKGFIAGLTGSREKIKSVAKDLSKDIKTAFSGHKESALLKMVSRDTAKLDKYASQRDKIIEKIKAAKAYASDTTKTARSQAALSALGMDPADVTAGRIKSGLAKKLAQIKQFSRFISTLAKRGLNKHLLRQILDMGPVDGYAYASALAGADKATFSAINKSQKAIDAETTKLGRKGADILYDSGKNAGKGFLKGLESQQKAIEKLMVKVAKSMEKAIKKALGIKSPSTVMAKLGVYSTQGLARGLIDGMPHLDNALGVVSGRVAATQPVLGRPAVRSAGGQGDTYTITVNGAIDPYATARELDKVLTKYRRGRGGASYAFT